MSKHWIVILLFISLAFNLAVMGMFLYIHFFHRPPFCPPGMRPPMGEFRDDRQFHHRDRHKDEFVMENKEEIRLMRSHFMQKRKDFMQILLKEDFNEQKAIAAMEASLTAQDSLEESIGRSLIELRKKMTPEQAKRYFEHRLDRYERRQRFFRPDRNESQPNINPKGE